jgi:UDP-N-acetylmuramate: L-alanyl-gamma-D-glutamyl-meso-diaminopimelate ligase
MLSFREYFKEQDCVQLASIPNGGKIYLMGICGTAMGQLAVQLKTLGYKVFGSDREYYDPMKSFLNENKIEPLLEFNKANITKDIDLVVIGNTIGATHVELEEVYKNKISYTILTKLLYELLVLNKKSIVVTGTHGKSTTSSLLTTALIGLDADPGYFIGAKVNGLPTSLALGEGQYSVLEGDEYDSAFFAKTPKFHFYKPSYLIITSIEFDHADIYSSLESIELEFSKLVRSLAPDSLVIVCVDNERLKHLVKSWHEETKLKFITYGEGAGVDGFKHYKIESINHNQTLQSVKVTSKVDTFASSIPLVGTHNALNFLSVYIILTELGFAREAILSSVAKFKGLKRRQDILAQGDFGYLIEDFAHHPTAVRETINAVKKIDPSLPVWAIFEPRSNTSRRKVFENDYIESLSHADVVLLKEVTARHNDSSENLIDSQKIVKILNNKNISAITCKDNEIIIEKVKENFFFSKKKLFI